MSKPDEIFDGAQIARKRKFFAGIVMILLSTLCFIGAAALGYSYNRQIWDLQRMRDAVYKNTIYPGVTINGIDVGGMTADQAQQALADYVAEVKSTRVAIAYAEESGKTWEIPLRTQSNELTVIETAYNLAREGDLQERYNKVLELANEGYELIITFETELDALETLAAQIAREVECPALDASVDGFDMENREFTFIREVLGARLDTESLLNALRAQAEAGQYPISQSINIETIFPNVTTTSLMEKNRLLASFSTTTTNDSARNVNIELASQSFNGVRIMPGETFSLNERTGERTPQKGYRPAGAIVNGKMVDETGGGVCQVSTTLFNAAVRAGLTVDERNNHSFPIGYVPRGHDAMINYPNQDLKLTNEGEWPVYLISVFENNNLTVEIYGTPLLEDGVSVELRAETNETLPMPTAITRYDSSKPKGTSVTERQGRTGYRVTTYIQYYKGEELIEERELFKSYYLAIAPIIVHGTRNY